MAAADGILKGQIPYYSMMKKAMPGPVKQKKKFKNHRLTEIDPKTKKPRLKQGVKEERAIEVLYMFENADVMPYQIEEMKQTIQNLQRKILKMQDWQD